MTKLVVYLVSDSTEVIDEVFASPEIFSAPTRARLGGAMLLDLLDRLSVQRQLAARFDGEVVVGAVADFVLVISGLGQRWNSGGRCD